MTRALVPLLLILATACTGDDPDAPEIVAGETAGIDDSPVEGTCSPSGTADPYADCVESFRPADDAEFGHDGLPEIVLGPPQGLGDAGGSMDVATLGCGGAITLFFDEPGIVDGPGPDLLVFENPFRMMETTFAEPARVLVSDDGVTWGGFACDVDGAGTWPPTGCAGIEPVHASGAPATDPASAGGDAFDLADVGLERARYVRLVDVSEAYFGDTMWCAGASGGFDLDAVAAVVQP